MRRSTLHEPWREVSGFYFSSQYLLKIADNFICKHLADSDSPAMNPIQFRISTAVWRTASPAARSQTTPAGASANVVASVGSSVASALQDSKNALTQNLLDSWRRQQSTSLASNGAASSSAKQIDSSRLEDLRQRAKMLRQMMLMAGKDKGSLRAIALQLKQIVGELRQLVGAGSSDGASGQDAAMAVSVKGSDAQSGQGGQDAGAGADAGSDAAADQSGAQAAQTVAGDSQNPVQSADANQAQSQSGNSGSATAAGGDNATVQAHANLGSASGGMAQLQLQTLISDLKSIQEWLKQKARQMKDDGLKDALAGIDKDFKAIDEALQGGDSSSAGSDASVTAAADASAADAGVGTQVNVTA